MTYYVEFKFQYQALQFSFFFEMGTFVTENIDVYIVLYENIVYGDPFFV